MPGKMSEDRHTHKAQIIVLLLVETVMIILFAIFVDYKDEASAEHSFNKTDTWESNSLKNTYPMFQDVHVMMFIGFGFLMTFLKRYGYSSVGINFLLAAICIQWNTLCQGFFHMHDGKIEVEIFSLLNADLGTAAVLISFGAVLGKTTPLQLIVMLLIETALFATNEWMTIHIFHVADIGASMFVHVFGAYFGLMVSFVLKRDHRSPKEGAVYHSDVFAMIGTIFLWLFWPSFNASPGIGDQQHRAVINTYYSLAACCVTAFAVSALVSKENKWDMVHIQNSTLAGGVAIGTAADMMVHPFGAMIVGATAATISVLGYRYLTPRISKSLGIHDTCGVHNLHGMPGILAGIVGSIVAASATLDEYSYNLYRIFPARAPLDGTEDLLGVRNHLPDIEPGLNRSASEQAAYQIVVLLVTLAISIVGGLLTGLIMRISFFGSVSKEHLFDDEPYWEVPEEELSHGHQESRTYQPHKREVADSRM
ncbi:ammonium transporter Rh type A-like isoform X2 [Artemia franciscana]|uniref:ammonium transporter Rh type A-like isoform X2 n=2 Tax=Artemia franciscana TaxID=6661 RepID=UPI0032DB6122